jgi:hypothetical protein
MFSPVKAAITPRRILALAPPPSDNKIGGGASPISAASGTPPSRCRSSPALVSPREEDQDTPTAGGRRKARHKKVGVGSVLAITIVLPNPNPGFFPLCQDSAQLNVSDFSDFWTVDRTYEKLKNSTFTFI